MADLKAQHRANEELDRIDDAVRAVRAGQRRLAEVGTHLDVAGREIEPRVKAEEELCAGGAAEEDAAVGR